MTSRCRLLLAILLPVVFTISASADTKLHNFDQAAISPDGKRVAWIGAADSTSTGTNISGLYVQNLGKADLDKADATPIRINTGSFAKASIEGVAWSSDSRTLAFL